MYRYYPCYSIKGKKAVIAGSDPAVLVDLSLVKKPRNDKFQVLWHFKVYLSDTKKQRCPTLEQIEN